MNRMTALGLQQLFAGARRGQPYVAGLGAAMSIIGYLRGRNGRKTTRVYARKLRTGEVVRVRLLRGEEVVAETDVEG